MENYPVLYNANYGGFHYSNEFKELYKQRWGKPIFNKRHGKKVYDIYEELGSERSSGKYCKIEVDWIPKNVQFKIEEYDGLETVFPDFNLEYRELLEKIMAEGEISEKSKERWAYLQTREKE